MAPPSLAFFTTGKLAAFCGVHDQTIIRWHRERLLLPSIRRKQPRKGAIARRGRRRYSMRDVEAALILNHARKNLRFPTPILKDVVRVVQRGSDEQHAASFFLTYRGDRMDVMRLSWVRHDDEPAKRKMQALEARPGQVIEKVSILEMLNGRPGQKGVRDLIGEKVVGTAQPAAA